MGCFGLGLVKIILFSVTIAGGVGQTYYGENNPYQFIGDRWAESQANEQDQRTLGSESEMLWDVTGILAKIKKKSTGHIICIYASNDVPNNKVTIKVFYESLCPGSINFLTNQLRPAVERLAPYLDVHLVPYGHAKTREIYGQYSFECQHGPQECYGNKIHACAIDVLKNNTQAALFNACVMQYSNYRKDPGFDYTAVVNWCNYKLNLKTKGIWACVEGERGSLLLKSYGEETRAVGLRYIPYVIIQDFTDKQYDATRDLTTTVCRMLQPAPSICNYSQIKY